MADGPESLEDYLQNVALLGQKVTLNLCQIRKNCFRAFEAV